ncbi:MAG: SDR family NAD(P)-dependent oxidoreductase, partial [Bacteroidetes bacterium]|nr:SDR family NAD(P)-dependent oxidoreductase [Bacteroidota bacterium]
MKTVLITGAGGFIGSHLAEHCAEKGYKVKAFVRYNSMNFWGWLEHSPRKNDMEIISGDIRDFNSVMDAMNGCDSVFHLAALIGIPYSYVAPLEYIKTNVEGTYNVLEAARKLNIRNIIVTSTSETYGTAQYVPIDEKHPLVGQSPYSASKIAADHLAVSYYRSFGLPVKIIRPFNCYGPRQSARAIIPTVITQILEGRKKINTGNTHPTRDLTFVKDLAKGYLALSGAKGLAGEATNFGNKKEISIRDLISLISDLMGKKVSVVSEKKRIRPGKSEVERL